MMRQRTLIAMGVGALGAGAIMLAGHAHADPEATKGQVIADLTAAGFESAAPDGLLNNAMLVCQRLPAYGGIYLAQSISQDEKMPLSLAEQFVAISVADLCPQEAGLPAPTIPATPPERMTPMSPNIQLPAPAPPRSTQVQPPSGSDL